MPYSATLLVSAAPSVVREVHQVFTEVSHTRLEVCGRYTSVSFRGTKLLLVHVTPSVPAADIEALLEEADRRRIPTRVLTLADDGPVAVPDRYPVFRFPDDLAKLREFVKLTAGPPHIVVGPTPQPSADDPIAQTLLGRDMAEQLERIRRVAALTTTILLTGETGSGKTLLTRYIHAYSAQRGEPYLVVDCGALSGQLIESEMFGHARGAYTGAEKERQGKFAAAGKGTLVLDEINSLPLPLQAKLLRAVEDRVFEPVGSDKLVPLRARLLAASNEPLEEAVKANRFRSDLYFRLNVIEFRIPSLRERPNDVVPLAHQLLRTSATAACQGVTAISSAALEVLVAHQWPGNVRELRNVIEAAAALAQGPVIQYADLPDSLRKRNAVPTGELTGAAPVVVPAEAPLTVEPLAGGDGEAERILAVLKKHKNNRRRAAAELGLSRVSMYKKLHKAGLFIPKNRIKSAS